MQFVVRSFKVLCVISVLVFNSAYALSALQLTSSDPANNASNVARVGTTATLTFSAELNSNTVSATHVILKRGTVKEPVALTTIGNQVIVQASQELLPATTYTITITGVQGSAGEALTRSINLVFRTRDGTWTTPAAIVTNDKNIVYPYDIAVNKADGSALAVWNQRTLPDDGRLFASRYINGHWDTPQVISPDYKGGAGPASIAIAADGSAVVVWQATYTSGPFTSTYPHVWANEFTVSNGWSTPHLIDIDKSQVSQYPRIAMSPKGNAVVVWSAYVQGTNRIYSREYNTSGGWSDAITIDAFSNSGSYNASIAFDKQGNGYAVWSQTWKGKMLVWGNRYVAGRGWIAPQIIPSVTTEFAADPLIAFDDNGNAIAVWRGELGLVASRYIRDQGWGTQQQVTYDNSSTNYKLAVAGNGDAFIASLGPIYGSNKQGFNVYATRYTPLNGWEATTLLQYPNGYDAYSFSLAADAAGNAIAVWGGFNGTLYRIYANRYVVGNGWVSRRVIDSSQNVFGADFPLIAMGASGNAIVIWAQLSQLGRQTTDIWFNKFE